MKKIVAVVFLVALLLPAVVLGQSANEDSIQLNFNGVSLREVVKAVEKVSGKRFLFDEALIADKRVSLFSSQPFPASRVMEVFESILQVEGLALVTSGEAESEILKIVDLKTVLKRPTPTFEKEDLETLRPGDQVVTLLLPLQHVAAEDAAEVLKPMASVPEGIAPVPGTNMVRVTDFAGNARRIAGLVERIDREGPKMVAETVVLEHMDPVDLVEEIRPLIEIENRLEIGRIQQGLTREVRRLMGRRGRNVSPGMIRVSGAQYAPVAVTPVPRLGAVIVSAEESRMESMLAMIKRLDVEDPDQKVVKYYRLKFVSPLGAATILSGVFDISISGLAGGRRGRSVRRSAPSRAASRKTATILPDEDLNTLVVVAPARTHEEIRKVLENIDVAGPNENVLKIYEVRHADLSNTATVISRLFGLSLEAEAARMRMISLARARRGRPEITAEEVVIPDENLHALLVVAPPPLHEKVEKALERIDVEGPGIQEVRTYALEYADAQEVASTLGDLFDVTPGRVRRWRGFRDRGASVEQGAVIASMRSQNKVMVSASEEMHARIEAVIRDLDAEGPRDNVVRYLAVAHQDVNEVALVVSQIFGLTLGSTATPTRRRAPRRPFEQNVVIPDENLQALVVVAPKAVFEKIEETVQKLDVAGPGEKVVRFYEVTSTDVEEAARILSGIFEIQVQTDGQAWRRRRRPALPGTQRDAVIIPHPEMSSIVVVAPKSLQEEVAGVLRQIDTGGPQENLLRYYPLRHADLIETANLLSQVFGLQVGSNQRGWRPRRRGAAEERRILTEEKIVIPDENLNSLLVVAPAEVQAEVEKTVARLDVEGPLENELRFYEVDDDFTETTASTLAQIFDLPVGSTTLARRARSRSSKSKTRFGADPVIIPDAAFGSIIVNAPREVHEQIASILEQLRMLVGRERMSIRFYRLKNTDADDIARKLGSLFDITVSSVSASSRGARSGIPGRGSASRAGSGRSGRSARRVEAPAGVSPVGETAGPEEEEEAIPVASGEGREYAWGGEPVVVPDTNLNAVIVIAPAYLHEEIRTILEKLDVRRPQVLFEVAIIDITADRDLDLGVEFSTIDPASENPRGHGYTSFGIGARETPAGGGFPATTTVEAGRSGLFAGVSKGAAGSLPVLVKLLQENSDVNIRSTPLLLVNDNEAAEFSSLRSEPTTSTSQGTATTKVSFAGYVEAGTVLNITPHVSEGNYIRLEISLQVDSFLGNTNTDGIPPPKTANFVDTSITVPNERTVIIGGLTSVRQSKTVDKVPLLGDIPLLGWLFRREVTGEKSTKLFLFIKPTILSDERFVDLNRISREKIREARQASGTASGKEEEEKESAGE